MYLLTILLIFLPTFLANAVPVLVASLPICKQWNHPVCSSLLGKNKTRRGWILGTLVGGLTGYVLFVIPDVRLLTTTVVHRFTTADMAIAIGLLQGCGALVGDMVESMIKRRLRIPPGAPLVFWDGIDYIVGSLCFLAPFLSFPWFVYVFLLLVGPVASLVANIGAYLLGLKSVWR